MPKISVVMGVYNPSNKEMLLQAINSILNQTYSDFEFIICDDGSNNESFKFLQFVCQKDNRIILLKNDINKGLAATLNSCLQIAKGEYIARMDADDISTEKRFQNQVDFLDNNNEYALVGCSAVLFDDSGDWGHRKMIEKPIDKSFLFNSPFIHPSIMIRKSALMKVDGYRVSKETLRCEDYDLFMRLYSLGMKGCNLNETLYRYREDSSAYKRRKYKFRIDEAKVKYKGFKQLGLLPLGLIYVLKPIIVGLIPYKVINVLRNERTT
ncbi:glycosyltransferase [Paenibacillus sp. FSL K6-0276]|uniref:glycosyltransferase n=1 Tax=Paenibacillus sp. FSL K6-0276 TaxID=2921450 RepID=UPI0030EF29DD